MMQKIEKKSGPGLQRVVLMGDDMVVNRATRRAITGVAFNAQRSRLVLDAPDPEGNISYPCKIADAADDGFGVICPAAAKTPGLFELLAQMTLEASDGKRLRVEIRWINKGRLGLRLLAQKSR